MVKVSVIIPVYNVEKYIERCAISLFEQTLDDIEYIFIDDCTPDNSITILNTIVDRYPNRKPNVHIFSMQKNSGQALARLYGFKKAKGEFIISCDSDDWVEKEMYECLYNKAVADKADVVICDYFQSNESSKKHIVSCFNTNRDAVLADLLFHRIPGSLCCKLFKTNMFAINNIIFPSSSIAEDVTLSVQLIWNANKISYLNKAFYYYCINPNSSTRKVGEQVYLKKYLAAIENVNKLSSFFNDKDISKEIRDGIVFIKNYERNILISIISKFKYYKMWLTTFPEINIRLLLSTNIQKKYKIRFIICLLGLYPTCSYFKKLVKKTV